MTFLAYSDVRAVIAEDSSCNIRVTKLLISSKTGSSFHLLFPFYISKIIADLMLLDMHTASGNSYAIE